MIERQSQTPIHFMCRQKTEAPWNRGFNIDAIHAKDTLKTELMSTVLVQADGKVRAFYMHAFTSFRGGRWMHLGLGSRTILPFVGSLSQGKAQEIRVLDVICGAITLDEARIRGVPENWLKQAQLQSPIQPQLLRI